MKTTGVISPGAWPTPPWLGLGARVPWVTDATQREVTAREAAVTFTLCQPKPLACDCPFPWRLGGAPWVVSTGKDRTIWGLAPRIWDTGHFPGAGDSQG